MHLQSYMYSFTKLLLKKVDRVCVCACVHACVRVSDPRFIQFAFGSCYAVHCQFNESVH